MTKFKTANRWGCLVITLNWYSKKIVGHHLSSLSRAAEWLEALEGCVQKQIPNGIRDQGLKLISDNRRQPTSISFTKSFHYLKTNQIFTSYNNPKGNTERERGS